MKNILFVDDEETLLFILESRFEEYKDHYNIFTARNGKEAVEILESTAIDFVLTDLNMPEMDGIELLIYLGTTLPHIPAMAMSEYNSPVIVEQLERVGTLRVLDKPVDLDILTHTIMKDLSSTYEQGALKGISVGSFLQLINMERKTCLLEVHGEEQKRGLFYFSQGELLDATCGDRYGEPAALEIIGWDDVQLYLKDLPKKPKKRITSGIMSLMMEGFKLKDEATHADKSETLESETVAEITEESVVNELEEDDESVVDELEEDDESVVDELEEDFEEEIPEETRKDQKPIQTKDTIQLEFISKIFEIINTKLKVGDLQAVFSEIQDVAPMDLAIIMSKDVGRPGYLTINDLMTSGTATISKGDCYPYEDSILADVMNHQAHLVVNDTDSLSNSVEKELFANQGLKACIIAPLLTDGIVTGILAMGAKKPGNFYDTHGHMGWIANCLSHAIERNRLSAALVKRKQTLDTSQQIGRALASSDFDINKVVKYSMDMIRKIMGVEAGSLLLKVKNELKVAIAFNIEAKSLKKFKLNKFRLKIGQGIAGYVVANGKSIIVNDTQQSSLFFPDVDKETVFKTQSAMCVPLISKEEVIGVIEVLNKINQDFDAGDEELLQSIADSLSIAIENARLFKESVSKVKNGRKALRMFQKFVPGVTSGATNETTTNNSDNAMR
jgi:GAF domain-containing protein/ActR/RegA family two-component response regulator